MQIGRVSAVILSWVAAGALYGGYKVAKRLRRPPAAREAPPPDPTAFWKAPPARIPTDHPRLWWTPERLARARQWAKKEKPPRFPADAAADEQAWHYLLTGDRESGQRAVRWIMGFTLDTSGVACDEARWRGEDALLAFDWAYDLLTPEQRRTFIERWNGYMDTLNAKQWGGIGMEGNNYYWGYLRNTFELAVTSYNENPQAPRLLAYALDERFGRGVAPYVRGPGRGAALPEGSQYGPYVAAYATIPLVTAERAGVDLWGATDFFKEAVLYFIYATTPAPTTTVGGGTDRFELFPFSDDEKFREGGSAERTYIGMYMLAVADHFAGTPIGGYAQAWLDMVKPKIPITATSWANPPGPARPFTSLPLDYYAPGMSYVYARTRWSPDTSVVHLQLGRPTGVGHEHADWGSFQIWRAGRWLTRETVAYGERIANWRGEGDIGADAAIGHNMLLFEGMGPRGTSHRKDNPKTLRLESRADYVYAAVDMSDSYRCDPGDCKPARDENEHAGRVVRELLFVRPLETLVVFDRIESTSERKPAAEVVKTFVLHTEGQPKIESGRLLATSGDQALRAFTLLPSGAAPRVVAEGGIGQYRTEIDTRGAGQSYFLNVLQARGASDPDLRVSLDDRGGDLTVTMAHPTRGTARVVLEKGPTSKGGKVGFARAGDPPLAPLTERVQEIRLGSEGPVWRQP